MQAYDTRIGHRALLVLIAVAAGCAAAAGCASDIPSGSDTQAGKDAGTSTPDTGSPPPAGDDDVGDDDTEVDSGNDVPDVNVPDTAPPLVGTPIALPFYVSKEFIPSGFMGDSKPSTDALKVSVAPADCKAPRQTGAAGDCYKVAWTASLPDAGGAAWVGVYWQSPADNWGEKQGKLVAPGATKVSFYAAGAVGGEEVQFKVGGINTNGVDPKFIHRDKFTVANPAVTLTTDWTKYEISLSSATYDEVLGGFCFSIAASSSGNTTFYIDDLQWQ